ncbi:hypothetical protein EYD10_01525 [Varanus komodoensis]|nr:hypothetical protein EYD10_01525 [Varanus komodoensis]
MKSAELLLGRIPALSPSITVSMFGLDGTAPSVELFSSPSFDEDTFPPPLMPTPPHPKKGTVVAIKTMSKSILIPTEQRIQTFLRHCLYPGGQKSKNLLQGLAPIQEELLEVGQRFGSLVNHNRQVFGPYYSGILKKLLLPEGKSDTGTRQYCTSVHEKPDTKLSQLIIRLSPSEPQDHPYSYGNTPIYQASEAVDVLNQCGSFDQILMTGVQPVPDRVALSLKEKMLLLQFADEVKLFTMVKTIRNCEKLQRHLSKLGGMGIKWQMQFNITKHKIMHFGSKNPNYRYMLMGLELAVTELERDLGVVMDSSMKILAQCRAAVKKANSTLDIIREKKDLPRSHSLYTHPWYDCT